MSAALARRLLRYHADECADLASRAVHDLDTIQAYVAGVTDDTTEAMVALRRAAKVLLRPAGWTGTLAEAFDPALLDEHGDTTRAVVHRMLLACWARAKLDRGGPVTTRELASMVGISLRRMQAIVAEEGIEVDGEGRDREIPAGAARRWLAKRGVLGFVGVYDAARDQATATDRT